MKKKPKGMQSIKNIIGSMRGLKSPQAAPGESPSASRLGKPGKMSFGRRKTFG